MTEDEMKNSELLQLRAAILWKYGRQYPGVFPTVEKAASNLYKMDRIGRGVE